MFEVTFNTSAIVARAKQLNASADQMPFAMSNLLNDAVFAARAVIVQTTWPSHVRVRNASFISAALRVQKATKENLSAHLYDQLKRGRLSEHETGATISSGAHRFAIPNERYIQRGSMGVPKGMVLRNLIANDKKNIFLTHTAAYERMKNGKLRYLYALTRSVAIKPTVPFHEVFEDVVNNHVRTSFANAVNHAMATAR